MQSQREIKFRIFDVDRKTMVYNFNAIGFPEYQLLQTEERSLICGNIQDNGDWQEPKLMQYTGLKDKNGDPIFEGDIVTYDTGSIPSHKIIYHMDGFKMKRLLTNQLLPLRGHYKNIEIIGNIYSNPELL
jgi:uncharacterized phage protein (TIGR01671 family)